MTLFEHARRTRSSGDIVRLAALMQPDPGGVSVEAMLPREPGNLACTALWRSRTSSLFRSAWGQSSNQPWFMMQIAMVCGFPTSYPVNWWLITSGIKEKM